MLRVIQNKSASSAKSYYTQADYLSEGQELVGQWGGKAAAMLGLFGEVDKQSFDRLCDNLDPRSGERLTLRTKEDRTVGYDFNWHLPKGVTLTYTLNGDERILDLFRECVEESMQEVEGDASTRVRKHGVYEERHTGNLAWSTFIHTTARPVDGEPDPHVHAHCFVQNITFDNTENAWKAGQFRELKRDASYYEAAFHARMAKGMKHLGYEIEKHGRSWDIAGLDKKTIDKFSRRTAEIEELAAELGIEDAKAKDELGAKSRAKKDKSLSMPELIELWRCRLNATELQMLDQLKESARASEVQEPEPSREVEAMAYAKLHWFERDSVVPKRQLLTEALRHGIGEVTVDGIANQLAEQNIIVRDLHGRAWATTQDVLAEEGFMLKRARDGRGTAEPLNDAWTISRDWLNADQRHAVQHVLNSEDQVMMIRGGAGTGKTSLMREAVDGIEAGGRKVFTFAPSAQASRGVLATAGFDATTVAELLVSEKLQSETQNQVIWIDESGLLGTRTLKQVMDVAEKHNARLVLSGDWKQHGSVERGAAMRLLEQHAGIEPAIVRKIQRQDGSYREVVALLAEGKTFDGFNALDRLGWVHEIEDADARYATIANSFANGVESGEKVLAIAPTHAEADLLTDRIRKELINREIIDKTDREFEQLKPLRLTEAEKTDSQKVAEGDVMVFHRAVPGVKKGTRMEATPENAKRYRKAADKFEVYRKQSLKLARGDLLKITSNGKTKDGSHALNNGQVYKIREFNKRGDIVLGNGWTVDREYGFLAPGYVSTSHSSQGKTVDRVLIAESSISYPAADRAQFYVSVSRGEHQAEIYTDDKQGLMDAVAKNDPRVSATELLHDAAAERIQRQMRQQNYEKQYERELEIAYERI